MTSGMVSPVPTPIPKPGHPTGKERDSNHHTSPLSLRTSKQYDERSIERTSYCSFWSLVRYLYVRQVSLSPEDAKEVYCLAVEYDVPGLKDAAKAAVINALTTTTVVEELMGWASGGKGERAEIRREMIEYLKIHWEEVKLANQGAGGTWFEICEVLAGQ
ncbi:hypothetical protein BT69DRAFT_996047 [Atractiella rhizophila]|nr:hypothetical protein BT69DRAFT_996047 [Atractiella rhizophila]